MPEYPDILRVDVSQYCIDNGQPKEADSCPIALAVRKMYPDVNISVDGWLYIDEYSYRSDAAEEFVVRFDGGEEVEPQTIVFELHEAPDDGDF